MSNEIKNNNYEMMKCIWMASGIVEYKLCDNQFDCEKCQFDKMLRNLSNDKETQLPNKLNVADNIFNRLKSINQDDKILYLKNNFIAKEICPDTFYLGLNPVFKSFLDDIISIIINENEKNIFAGQKLVEILGTWGTISLAAPINCIIYDKFDNSYDIYLKSQWLAIIGAVKQEISNIKLPQEKYNSMHQKAFDIVDEIRSLEPTTVTTMFDGGTNIKFLHQLIGKKRYLDILNSFFV